MPFLSGVLAVGAGVAALIGAGARARAGRKAARLQERQADADEERAKEIARRDELQRKENEKARRKSALQRAFGIQGGVAPKQVPGLAPRTIIRDPSIQKAANVGNIFQGISGGLSAAASSDFFNRPFTRSRGVTPGVSVLFKPTKQFQQIA